MSDDDCRSPIGLDCCSCCLDLANGGEDSLSSSPSQVHGGLPASPTSPSVNHFRQLRNQLVYQNLNTDKLNNIMRQDSLESVVRDPCFLLNEGVCNSNIDQTMLSILLFFHSSWRHNEPRRCFCGAGEQGRESPDLQDSRNLSAEYLQRKRAFRYTPGLLEKNTDPDSEQDDSSPASPVVPFLAKTSSSEWNSSDDLTGPLSEQEDTGTAHIGTQSHSYPPPLPQKTFTSDLSGIHAVPPDLPARPSPRLEPKNGLPVPSHTTLRRWIETPSEHRLSSDASSKSGSSDQDRTDLSTSEGEDRLPSPKPRRSDCTDSSSLTEKVLPTTFFSVDSCMTDTYRAKYHRKPGFHRKGEDHTSSGESDAEGRGLSVTNQPSEPSRSKTEPGHSATKTIAKWNPVTPKGLDEHGFL